MDLSVADFNSGMERKLTDCNGALITLVSVPVSILVCNFSVRDGASVSFGAEADELVSGPPLCVILQSL